MTLTVTAIATAQVTAVRSERSGRERTWRTPSAATARRPLLIGEALDGVGLRGPQRRQRGREDADDDRHEDRDARLGPGELPGEARGRLEGDAQLGQRAG